MNKCICIEKHVLNDEAIPSLSEDLNKRLKTKFNDNHEKLINFRNNLYELEQVTLNLELKIN